MTMDKVSKRNKKKFTKKQIEAMKEETIKQKNNNINSTPKGAVSDPNIVIKNM